MAEGRGRGDFVMVAAPNPFMSEIARLSEVGNDALGRALGDAGNSRYAPGANVWILPDQEQNPLVIG